MSRKRFAGFVAVALLAVGAQTSPAGAATTVLRSTLSGTRTLPFPGDPDGTGGIFMWIDDDTNRVCTVVWVRNVGQVIGAHIHFGAEGETGGHALDLNTPTRGTSVTCGTESEQLVQQLLAEPENFYANVHSAEFPDGAVRGQLQAI